jgi:hypothetical protein
LAQNVVSAVSPLMHLQPSSWQRELSLPMVRTIPLVPMPSAVSKMIRARQTCFCGLLRSRMIDCKRARSAGVTSMVIPLRMPQHRTAPAIGEPKIGVFCQVLSTSNQHSSEIQ